MSNQNSTETKKKSTPTVSFSELPSETQAMFRKLQLKSKISEQYHQAYFGNTPPIISVDAFGKRMVAVGGKIVHSDDPNHDWETPSDFLVSFLKSTLGNLWIEDELRENYKDRHEIAKWYSRGVPNIEDGGTDFWERPNGKALALLHLAYDLFVLENVGKLPNFIIERLKKTQNFNGARYELFVFATMLRAGFDISYSDERSGLIGRVPDCLATYKESHEKVYVEAKTRNVKNVLGSRQGKSKKIRLYDKLKDAINKDINGPYVIFIDANHPHIKAERGNRELERIRSEYRKVEKYHKDSMPNLVCVTNIPFHYGADDCSPNQNLIGLLIPNFPKHKLDHKDNIVKSIDLSLKRYDFLPKEFGESESYADKLLDQHDA